MPRSDPSQTPSTQSPDAATSDRAGGAAHADRASGAADADRAGGAAADRASGTGDAPLRVLIIEDNTTVAASLDAALHQAGMITRLATTGTDGIEAKQAFRPDVVLVDLDLPDVSGFRLVEQFGHDGDCGIIVVTANDAEAARIMGLDTGADDYIVKPPALRELAARIRAVHRRLVKPDPAGADRGASADTRVTVDRGLRSLMGPSGRQTLLTEAEMAALELLLAAAGASVSRARISEVALKRPLHEEDRSVDQLVLKLRRKLSSQGVSERLILSTRREGYMIADHALFLRAPTGAAEVGPA